MVVLFTAITALLSADQNLLAPNVRRGVGCGRKAGRQAAALE
jgi:hypothetical protein